MTRGFQTVLIVALCTPGFQVPAEEREGDEAEYAYALPFALGEGYLSRDAFGDNGSHHSNYRYSVDFAVPLGTPVHAARDGVVIEVKEDSRIGGPEPELFRHQNLIGIKHADDSVAHYWHLAYNGSEVEIGDKVWRGQLIGYSGETGYAFEPMLHFHVAVDLGDEHYRQYETFPWVFLTREGPAKPVRNWYYEQPDCAEQRQYTTALCPSP